MILGLAMLLLAAVGLAARLGLSGAQDAAAAPEVFTSPIHAGCYITAPGDCRIHVERFTVNVDDGNDHKLAHFQITANGQVIYDFKPDMASPPLGNYVPSLVKKDFAARCNQTYTVSVLAQDTGDQALQTIGTPDAVTCPVGTFTLFLPVIDG